jgi:dTDP-4-amino-4,6-dideoxygalactose transaminase
MKVPFNIPHATGKELQYIKEAIELRHLSGDGKFSRLCEQWLQTELNSGKALLTHSCTGALEMAALLADIQVGDEVIMPSFTFVSTANAFVLRGAIPVFVDCRADTLNIDESLIEQAITEKTKSIVPVHYAGVACEMDSIMAIAERHNLCVIEDAAQGILASYNNRKLGSIGHLAALSFHETKNLIAGESGAILVNKEEWADRAEILREKGTNRRQFFRGVVDKYTWVDIGSSFLPSELQAAFLWAQMESAAEISERRMKIWNMYHERLTQFESKGLLKRPQIPANCTHNAHLYYIQVNEPQIRAELMAFLRANQVDGIFHYIPLHSSPGGQKFGRAAGALPNTELLSETLLRLPLSIDLTEEQIEFVVAKIAEFFATRKPQSLTSLSGKAER